MTAFTDDEIAALRQDTPGVEHVNHMNHAGSSLPTRSVLDTQISFLELEAQIGGYEAKAERATDMDAVHRSIADLIGARPHEIAQAEQATAAWNAGFWSIPMAAGQRILTAEAAYGANAVAFLRARQRFGVEIDIVPSDEHGQVDVEELERRLDESVALVAITHVPTNGGLVNPAADIGALTRASGVPFLLDACQSVGQLAVDVHDIGCDLLSVTGRKYLRGPRGTGFLYASDNIVDRLVPDHPDHVAAVWTTPDTYVLNEAAHRFETFEYNFAGWLGLGAAVDEANRLGLDRIEATVKARAAELRESLVDSDLPVFDIGRERCAIVTTNVDGRDPFDVRDALRAQNINVSVTMPDNTLWDATRRNLSPMVRLSVHYITTTDEIEAAVAALVQQRK